MTKSFLSVMICAVFTAFLFFSGCALHQTDTSSTDPKVYEPGSGYYYYSQAQLKMSEGLAPEAIELMEKAVKADPASVYLKKELVTYYLKNNDSDNALKTASELAEKNPNDVEVLLLYAGVRQLLKTDPDGVLNTYEKVIKLDPKQKNVYLMLGKLYVEKNDQKNAYRIYSDLVHHFPDSYVGYFYLGRIHMQKKEYAESEKNFRKALEIDPAIEAPKFELVTLYKLQKKNEKAIEMYRKIIADNPDNVHAQIGLGLFYGAVGMKEKSEQVFYLLSKKTADMSFIVSEIMTNYIEINNIKDAVIALKGLLKAQPDNSDLNYAMAVAYDRMKKKDETLHYLKKVQPDSRFYTIAVVHSAAVLHESGNTAEAVKNVEKAIENQPDNLELINFLAYLYEETGNYDKAVSVLKSALSVDENNTRIHYRLGVIYDKAGNKQESINSMKKVIEIEPANANALNYLGYTYADLGTNLDEAERLITEALRFKPEDGYIIDSLGWLYYQRGNYEKALEYLTKAGSRVKNDPTIFEHLGDVYTKLKDTEKASENYKKSLELYKDDTSKDRIKDKLNGLKKQAE